MKIVDIFAPYLYAITFAADSLDEYNKAIDQWNDSEYLKKFYEQNESFIKDNKHFPINGIVEFVEFISDNADKYDDTLADASADAVISEHFEFLYKGRFVYELLPHRKSKFQVLRLYGIQLGDIVIIAGSAIKLTQDMDQHPDTARQLEKIILLQDFLRENLIHDEESFFGYLSEQD